ncbi:MAG: RNA methyltransferase [Clostridia bacterium]|nr:RNA methyltransferase [Clostridia bacterium]
MSNILPITDFCAPELDVYARLSEAQLLNREYPEKGMFIAESPKVIQRALDAGYQPVSFLVEDRHLETQAKELIERCGDIPVYTASFDVLTQLTGFMLTRGMLCAMRRPPLPSVAEVCTTARRVAVLENVMNPTNIGAIFRSAAALNMDAVLLTPACSDPLYRRAIRVSMGTVFQVPWTWLEGENYVEQLRQLGFRTAAMALKDDSLSIRDPRLTQAEKLAVILGTEGDGLADCTIEGCDYTVKIPMTHGVDSLNVAAASAVAFWQLGGLE